MQLIQEWPDQLRDEHDALEEEGADLLKRGDFAEAADAFDRAFRVVLAAQPEARRYHKGEALHNKGLALMLDGRRIDAVEATLAAFAEDAASLAEEDPRPLELDRPAAHNLVFVFGVPGPLIADIGRRIRGYIGAGVPIPDATAIVGVPERIHEIIAAADAGFPQRVIGDHRVAPDQRVFLGGYYGRIDTAIRPLRDHLASLGLDGVVAADFGTPSGWGPDEVALALLRNCHFAVFEVSESAGQVEEIADVPETMRIPERVMAVFDASDMREPRISAGMTKAKLDRWGVAPVGYESQAELNRLVEDWLRGQGAPP